MADAGVRRASFSGNGLAGCPTDSYVQDMDQVGQVTGILHCRVPRDDLLGQRGAGTWHVEREHRRLRRVAAAAQGLQERPTRQRRQPLHPRRILGGGVVEPGPLEARAFHEMRERTASLFQVVIGLAQRVMQSDGLIRREQRRIRQLRFQRRQIAFVCPDLARLR